jgi:uncharacterized protein
MRSLLAIHGSFGSPYENWLPWLFHSSAGKEIAMFAPPLPSPVGQSFDSWAGIIDGYFNAGVIDDDSIVVAHSSGCPFLVKFLGSRARSVGKVIFVAGFTDFVSGNEDFDRLNLPMFPVTGDYSSLMSVKSRVAFYSDNDPYLSIDLLRRFAGLTGSREILVPGGGHFNSTAGFTEFSALFEEIIS